MGGGGGGSRTFAEPSVVVTSLSARTHVSTAVRIRSLSVGLFLHAASAAQAARGR